jgi:hypothetical protein
LLGLPASENQRLAGHGLADVRPGIDQRDEETFKTKPHDSVRFLRFCLRNSSKTGLSLSSKATEMRFAFKIQAKPAH